MKNRRGETAAALLILMYQVMIGAMVLGFIAAPFINYNKSKEVEKYVNINRIDDRIKNAMERRELVEGMTKEEAEIILGGKGEYVKYDNGVSYYLYSKNDWGNVTDNYVAYNENNIIITFILNKYKKDIFPK